MKLKVCGNRDNIEEVVKVAPDYMGFIFWEPSKRFFKGSLPELPKPIKKVGVFVDAEIPEVLEKVREYQLDGVQLHGSETPGYCRELKEGFSKSGFQQRPNSWPPEIIKVFSIKNSFDFSVLEPYEAVCDFYLFDTKGKLPGGNGYTFDWGVLKNYPSTKPFFISGGIGLGEKKKLTEFLKTEVGQYCQVVDINSRFEIEPGLKDMDQLMEFKEFVERS